MPDRRLGAVGRPGFRGAFFLVKRCAYAQETPAGGSPVTHDELRIVIAALALELPR